MMNTRTFLLYLFIITPQLLAFGCAAKPSQQNSADEFERLRQMVLDGKFEKAIPKLKEFATGNTKPKLSSRAGLFLFKCYFAQGNSDDAEKWCRWTIDNHPASLEAKKCMFKLAMIKMVDGDFESAKTEFEKLSRNKSVPQSPEALRMVEFIAEFLVKKENEHIR